MTADDFKTWRDSMSYTQSQAAFNLGVTPSAVYRWESGQRKIPRTIEILCFLITRYVKE